MSKLNKTEGKLYNMCKINTKIGLDFIKKNWVFEAMDTNWDNFFVLHDI